MGGNSTSNTLIRGWKGSTTFFHKKKKIKMIIIIIKPIYSYHKRQLFKSNDSY